MDERQLRMIFACGFSALLLILVRPGAALSEALDAWKEPTSGIEFVQVAKGCFRMGVPDRAFQTDHDDLHKRAKTEMPQHEVCLDKFSIARTEVTEAQWQAVMGTRARPADELDRPAVHVSWDDVKRFIETLNQRAAGAGSGGVVRRFRLPTEAEWEHACRSGAPARVVLPAVDDVIKHGWVSTGMDDPSSRKRLSRVQPVAGKLPNAWGIFDMIGNAWEWVEDGYRADGYARHSLFNPVHPDDSGRRVIRGGGVRTSPWLTRCESRGWLAPADAMDVVGFRLVVSEN